MDPGATSPLSLILAVYGAIIATLVALWNIYQHVVTHRGNLKLSLRVTTEDTIWFKVVNMGHRPVWLHAIGGRNKMGEPPRLSRRPG